MIPKFASKEFHFLKPGSEDHPVRPPAIYFSDLLHTRPVAFETFEQRLAAAEIPETGFMCAVLQVTGAASEEVMERARDIFEACFHSVLDKKRGIWECLDNGAFILVFWDFDNDKKARQLLASLKDKISKALNSDLLVGVAMMPFHDFSRSQTFGNALKALDHAAFFGPGTEQEFNAISLNISGDRLYQLGRYDDAILEYEKGLCLEPKNINLINSLGVCFGVTEDLEKARDQFEQALAVNPKEIMVVYNLGLIHQIRGDMDKAILHLRKAHGIDDAVFEVELLLGHLLFKHQKSDQALPHLEAASRLNPESGLAFRIQGETLLGKKEIEKAGIAFNSAVKLNPSDAVALSGYAAAMAARNRNLSIALTFAKKSVSLEPDNPLFRERLEAIREQVETAAKSKEPTIKSA